MRVVGTKHRTGTGGTGTHPAGFTSAADAFVIQNGSTYTMTAAWTIVGSLQINSGGALDFSATGTAKRTLSIGGNLANSGTIKSTSTSNGSPGHQITLEPQTRRRRGRTRRMAGV